MLIRCCSDISPYYRRFQKYLGTKTLKRCSVQRATLKRSSEAAKKSRPQHRSEARSKRQGAQSDSGAATAGAAESAKPVGAKVKSGGRAKPDRPITQPPPRRADFEGIR